MEKAYDVFISHSSKDAELAEAIYNYLNAGNLRCWTAQRNLTGGTNYIAGVMKAIQHSKIMVLILSEHSNESKHVHNEVEQAFKHDLFITPFIVNDIKPFDELEYFISSKHWIKAFETSPRNYFDDLKRSCYTIINDNKESPQDEMPSKQTIQQKQYQSLNPPRPPGWLTEEEWDFILPIIHPLNENQRNFFYVAYQEKRKTPEEMLRLCLIGLIVPGLQRFVIGQTVIGFLYFCTLGICFMGSVSDLVKSKTIALEYDQKIAKKMAYESTQVAEMSY